MFTEESINETPMIKNMPGAAGNTFQGFTYDPAYISLLYLSLI